MAWASDSFFSEYGHLPAVGPGPLTSIIDQVIAAQRNLRQVLVSLSDSEFRQKPVGVVPSSIGGHVRHCLDHVEALLSAVASGRLNYDDRRRGTDVEQSRQAAFDQFDRQEELLRKLRRLGPQFPLELTALLDPSRPPTTVSTTLGRELAFVLSHTVHHSALVAVMEKLLGKVLPDRFGYAPATIAHLDQIREGATCAR